MLNVTYFYPLIINEIKSFNPDIVDIIEEPYSCITGYTVMLLKMFFPHVKICFFSAQNIYKKYPFPFSWIQSYVLKNSDFAFPCSSEVAEILKKQGYKKNYAVLPLGTDVEKFKCVREYNKTKLTVGFAGRLEKVKGIDILLEAICKDEFKNVDFKIAGVGSMEVEVKEKIKSYYNIELITDLKHEQMPEFYKNIDILLNTSVTQKNIKEQFGRVVVEAMAAGCIVITSNSGEPKNLVLDKTLIYNENSSEELSKKLETVINLILNQPEKYKELSINNIKHSQRNYSWEKVAQITFESYKTLIKVF